MSSYDANTAEDYSYIDDALPHSDALGEIVEGLLHSPRRIHPKYFYDTKGSELFEQITQLPEYYPTRTELGIFDQYAEEIAECCGLGAVIVEPGSGNSEKIRMLLDALQPLRYVPIDIAGDFLDQAASRLSADFPSLEVVALCADFHQLNRLPLEAGIESRLLFYPGSTIGNMEPQEARAFLRRLRGWLTTRDRGLLIGIDLHKDTGLIEAAYNDEDGVTAKFNKNILDHVNGIASGDFDPKFFEHRAVYNTEDKRIEMYLDSTCGHTVRLNGDQIKLKSGESILTEYSYKYTLGDIENLASNTGFKVQKTWIDDEGLFSVSFLVPV